MYNQDRLIENVNNYHLVFDDIKAKFLESCSGNDVDFDKWQESRKETEKLLEQQIERVSVSSFKLRIKADIKDLQKEDFDDDDSNFDKFCYFIDRLNKEKYTPKIKKYNPDYCSEILKSIAVEYVKILNLLKTKEEHLLKANQKEFEAAKKQLISEWGKMLNECVNKIIEDEYNSVIQEVNNEVFQS